MVFTEKKTYPQLEMDTESKYSFAVQLFFDEIKEFSLFWLALEELELRYPDAAINKDLVYRQIGNNIEVLERETGSSVAQIRFN
ncbi:hypothetical protein C900_02102 [Fulvivirga imtechensis AK7]|uniref:Uncharacterized protein n=1 Tax=Fulvivirga imtechensis AK7 TaxID=1237149 RepID=L8JZX1_9BACT|nr:hypothetical protein [Fulvivirga imtechensis]ELR73698.1 hypothetical protein C900_02102 [Fulvivirga imtechensis AK7]